MSHHHHHRDPYHKRQQPLAWFGLVWVVVIMAFLGLAIWAGNPSAVTRGNDQPPIVTVSPIENPPPIAVNPPLGPVQGEPPGTWSNPVGDQLPPVIEPHFPGHHYHHDRQRHRSHHRRGYAGSHHHLRGCLDRPPIHINADVTWWWPCTH